MTRLGSLGVLGFVCVAGCDGAIGSVCTDEADCGENLECSKPPADDGGVASVGVCAPARRSEGTICTSTEECQSGLFCSNDIAVGTNQRYGTCLPTHDEGGACWTTLDCSTGLVCVGADAGGGVCRVAGTDASPDP